LVTYYAHYAEADVMWTLKEKVDELECKLRRNRMMCLLETDPRACNLVCTPEGVDAFAKELFERLYIEGLIHGNMDKEVSGERDSNTCGI